MPKFIIVQQFDATVTNYYSCEAASKEEALEIHKQGLLECENHEIDYQRQTCLEIGQEGENLEEIDD